jgi:general secretion pathway protein C
MSARWVTFLVWALVAASAAAWGLKLFVTAASAPPQVAVAGQSQLPRGDVTRVLGADAPPVVDPSAGETLASAPADARFQLVGVVAPRGSETARGGVALIAVDGKPPKAFRIGAVVDGENVVQAIRARGADLGPMGGRVMVALNIPPPAPAATGTLPDARSPGSPGAPASPTSPGTPGPGATPMRAPTAAPSPGPTPAPQRPRTAAPAVPVPAVPAVPVAPPPQVAPPAPGAAPAPQGQPVPAPGTPLPGQPMGGAQPQLR